jgi:ketosteroid isomerase-like protein
VDLLDEAFARDFLDRYLRAWNRREPAGLLALATEDVLWEDPTIAGGRAEGPEAVRSWLRSFWAAFPDVTFDYLDGTPETAALSLDRRTLIAPWRCRGRWLGPLDPPGFAPNGAPFEQLGVDLYRFRDGALAHVRTLTDLHDAGRQLGLLPPAGGPAERLMVAAQRLTRWRPGRR